MISWIIGATKHFCFYVFTDMPKDLTASSYSRVQHGNKAPAYVEVAIAIVIDFASVPVSVPDSKSQYYRITRPEMFAIRDKTSQNLHNDDSTRLISLLP